MSFSILYLDDERDNLTAFRAIFRRFFNIYTAETATEAFDLLHSTPVDLVISDQRMPGMSGVEFLEQVYQDYPDTIRMILTGYSDIQAVIDAINKGRIYYYISKPWKFEELKLILDNALETYVLRQQNERLEAEKLALTLRAVQQEKEHIASQYEVLKNQINPHFLFNALNTLASLIASDQQSAIRFATRFAKMYRNLLEFGAHQLIPLTQELDMIDNYMYLQQIRFGADLSLVKQIDNLRYTLPPFALQLLVENAIKHNVISHTQPLQIQIRSRQDALEVINNLQLRPSRDHSTGIGLSNLRQRYLMLTGKNIEIWQTDYEFTVVIPLIPDA